MQTVIVRGIHRLRQDNRYIDQLFRNITQANLQQVRNFLKSPIDIALNYPRDTLKLPAIVILLKSESEAQAWLGNSEGIETPDIFSYDGDIDEDDILGGNASVSSLSGQGTLLFGPYRASSATKNTLSTTTPNWDVKQFVGFNLTVRIVAGKGRGQIRSITDNTRNTLTISSTWLTIPDNTSVFEIRSDQDEVLGEPSKLYNNRANNFIERKGVYNNCTYQIQVIAANQEQTIFLYSILKAIFFLSVDFMEEQGLINFRMSGTDFLPKTEFQPDFAYMRALTVDFIAPFDIFEQLGPFADQFQIDLTCGEDIEETIISSTTIDNIGKPAPEVDGP